MTLKRLRSVFFGIAFLAEGQSSLQEGSFGVVTWPGKITGKFQLSSVEQSTNFLEDDVRLLFSSGQACAALKVGGEVVAWGNSGAGGDSSHVEAELRGNVTTIFSNDHAFAALKAGGGVVAWGYSESGGDSSHAEAKLRGNVTTIFSNPHAFAALKVGGEVVTWGGSFFFGDSSHVEAKLRGNVTTIFSNAGAFAALKIGGEVVTWGHSSFGGDSSHVETKLRGNVTTIVSNDRAFAALKVGGEVVTWGDSSFGGDSSAVQAFFPNSRISSIIECGGSFAVLICIPRRPSGKDVESTCELCSPDSVWAGLIDQCKECENDKVPNAGQNLCEPCSAGLSPESRTVCTECQGNFFAEAGSTQCQMCPIGKVSHDNKDSCIFCASDKVAEQGSCESCPYLFNPNEAQLACTADVVSIIVRLIYMALLSMLVKCLFVIFASRYVVIDVSLKQGKSILTTLSNHSLSCPPYRPNFPIRLHGTCHPGLDAGRSSKPQVAKAKVASSNTLELLDVEGSSISERFDTSSGTLSLTYADSCIHVSLMSIPLALLANVIFVAILLIAIYSLTATEAGAITVATVLSSVTMLSFVRMRQSYRKSPLENKLDEFRGWLSTVNPKPTSCPKGPGRAIRLDKLLETYSFFRAFIQDRTAYYLDGNILKPLTAKHRLSYAELVGPEQVGFFVSHFWGTEFSHFCASLQRHAETVKISKPSVTEREMPPKMSQFQMSEPFGHRQHVAYWICFCSNNQYDLHNELGGDAGWQESSFYLALQSPTCQCTCMVLDDKALPLTRSWCIFETLQSLKLSRARPGFDLLMCTESGVLNFGNSSIEAAIGIVKRVARMDLQEASASNEADKVMIDRLVLEEMGTFDELNNFIRKEIHMILENAQKTCTSEFENLFHILDAQAKMHTTTTQANTPQNMQLFNEDERHSEMHQMLGRPFREFDEIALQVESREQRAEVIRDWNHFWKKREELQIEQAKLQERMSLLGIQVL